MNAATAFHRVLDAGNGYAQGHQLALPGQSDAGGGALDEQGDDPRVRARALADGDRVDAPGNGGRDLTGAVVVGRGEQDPGGAREVGEHSDGFGAVGVGLGVVLLHIQDDGDLGPVLGQGAVTLIALRRPRGVLPD